MLCGFICLKGMLKIVYPYAILAQATFDQCHKTLKTMSSESDKKHYVKKLLEKTANEAIF